jgi:hypothetical protein
VYERIQILVVAVVVAVVVVEAVVEVAAVGGDTSVATVAWPDSYVLLRHYQQLSHMI